MESISPSQCEKCKAPIPPGTLLCPHCGAPTPNVVLFQEDMTAPAPVGSTAKRSTRYWIGLLGILGGGLCSCLSVAGLAFYLLSGTNPLPDETTAIQEQPPSVEQSTSLPPPEEDAGVTPTSPPEKTLKPTTGKTKQPAARSFADDFSNPDGGWKKITNENYSMGYTPDGTYNLVLRIPDETVVSYPPHGFAVPVSDVVVRFRASGQTGDGSFGVICHLKDNKNFYRISFKEGFYAVDQFENGEYFELTKPIFKPLIAYQPAPDGMMNIEVACMDGRIQLVVNEVGQEIITVSDQASGDICLFAASRQQAGPDGVYMQAYFDDFSAELP